MPMVNALFFKMLLGSYANVTMVSEDGVIVTLHLHDKLSLKILLGGK